MRAFSKACIAILACSLMIWTASQWWEKGFATNTNKPMISPNKCYRIETYYPFWILPSFLQLWHHPDDEGPSKFGVSWILPGFDKLYDNRTGALLGESRIYDLGEPGGGGVTWGDKRRPIVQVGMIDIGPNVPDCIGDQPIDRALRQ